MKRKHNVIAGTLLVLGIIYLCAQREGNLRAQDSFLASTTSRGKPIPFYGLSKTSSSTAVTPTPPPGLDSGQQSIGPLPQDLSPPPPGQQPSSENGLNLPPPGEQPPLENGLNIPPPDGGELPTFPPADPEPFNPEFLFQQNLNLILPIPVLQKYSNRAPINYNPAGPPTYAYATFMATRNPSLSDPYFLAIHTLIYRLLWSRRSRSQRSIPFIVFVADFVTPEQRALLTGAGAVVRELAPLPWHCDSPKTQKRWQDLFAKLNMWAETSFSRILFLDADAFPVANIDSMFDLAPVQKCNEDKLGPDDYLEDKSAMCEDYVFAGVPQSTISVDEPEINVGAMVFRPSEGMHKRLVQNYQKTQHYECSMAEQAFLNWQFSPLGAYPPTRLDREWGGFFPKEDEEGKLKVVHEKLWSIQEGWMKNEWEGKWRDMIAWYDSEEFAKEREKSVLV